MILLYSLYNRPSYPISLHYVTASCYCSYIIIYIIIVVHRLLVRSVKVFNGGAVGLVVVCVYNECENLHNAQPWTGES